MDVVLDPVKDAENHAKHGVSLERVADFDFTAAFLDQDDSQDYGEVRWNAIGWLDAKLHALTFTMRGSKVRPISLRKATKQEQRRYAEEFQGGG